MQLRPWQQSRLRDHHFCHPSTFKGMGIKLCSLLDGGNMKVLEKHVEQMSLLPSLENIIPHLTQTMILVHFIVEFISLNIYWFQACFGFTYVFFPYFNYFLMSVLLYRPFFFFVYSYTYFPFWDLGGLLCIFSFSSRSLFMFVSHPLLWIGKRSSLGFLLWRMAELTAMLSPTSRPASAFGFLMILG